MDLGRRRKDGWRRELSSGRGEPVPANRHARRKLRLQRLSAHLITTLFQCARAAQAALWLGVLQGDDLQDATDLYYNSTTIYASQEYNLLGLHSWERSAVEQWFPEHGRILVTSVGGGREVCGLAKLGFDVDGFEHNEKLAGPTARWLEGQGIRARIFSSAASDVPALEGPYDGVLVGWASYMHIAHREHRIAFLKKLRAAVKTGAVVILSFYTREESSWEYRWVAWLANRIRGLLLGKATVEVGDWVEISFEHYFTRVEIETELRAAGLRMAHYSTMDYGHAVGIADL
jgi:hypothetical protein